MLEFGVIVAFFVLLYLSKDYLVQRSELLIEEAKADAIDDKLVISKKVQKANDRVDEFLKSLGEKELVSADTVLAKLEGK